MTDISKQYSQATLKDGEALLNDIVEHTTKEQTLNGLYIAIQYLSPLLKKNVLRKGRYIISSKGLGQREIFVFHTQEQETLNYLVKKGLIKQCPPFSITDKNILKASRSIYKSPEGFLTDYMKAHSPEERFFYRPAEHMVIVSFNWEKLEEEKSTIVASWKDLDLHSDGSLWYKKKFTEKKIDRTRKTYQGQFLFLKHLMNSQSKQKEERLLIESEIKQSTKLNQNLTDLKDKINKKLVKTEYVITQSGVGFMLVKRQK
ncbi:MAG: hypothetical protein AB9915_01750 [Candidatus Dojkabacteria bacterium]